MVFVFGLHEDMQYIQFSLHEDMQHIECGGMLGRQYAIIIITFEHLSHPFPLIFIMSFIIIYHLNPFYK